MRIFLDANILFSAARSQGAMRELLHLLQSRGHTLVADEYVVAEALRNLDAKESGQAVKDLLTLLSVVQVSACRVHPSSTYVSWLPPKDQPVLLAAIDLRCDVLVTGDKAHFGGGYGKTYAGVMVCSPAALARSL